MNNVVYYASLALRELQCEEQPFLLGPKSWDYANKNGLVRFDNGKFFVGKYWVMRAEYLSIKGEDPKPRTQDINKFLSGDNKGWDL